MVRNYVRKTNRGSWSVEQIKNAVSAVLDQRMSCSLAAKTFGIPKTTLTRKIKRFRGHDPIGSIKIRSKINCTPQEDVQSPSTSTFKQSKKSKSREDEDTTESEDNYMDLPNTNDEEPISINNTLFVNEINDDQYVKSEDDVCELYGKILAKKLRQVPEHDRLEIMYEIDGLLLNKLRSLIPSNSSL